jgi:dTDP-4-dehydrorhamnose 3,5-epimerase
LKFISTALAGAFVIELEPLIDERGFFARTFCQQEFEALGLDPVLRQCSISFNHRRGTLRGMHYQATPHEEAKLVRCTRGAIHDVILDLRASSPTFSRWIGVRVSADNRRMVYIPRGFAHGFQTLVDDSEVFYQMSEFYHPECARGLRWNDPRFAIEWPLADAIISARDRSYPDFE